MSSSSQNGDHHESDSQCPDCKKKYISSSDQDKSQSQSNQRIIIPLRKDLLGSPASAPPVNDQVQFTLKTLQSQIQNLKHSNLQKDKMIDDLKKQIEHKITHYMIYGEINKQADEINRLKTEMSYGTNVHNSRRINDFNQQHIRQIVKQQSQRYVQRPVVDFNVKSRDKNGFRRKTHSTLDNYGSLKRELLSPRNHKQGNYEKPILIQYSKEYFNNTKNKKPLFNISQAKQKINQLEQKIKMYQSEFKWMTNFINTFIRSMQGLAYKKYQQQIIIPEWDLKKKAKVSWRYLKHVFTFLYSDPVI